MTSIPQVPTHVVVIPKAHYPDAASLAEADPALADPALAGAVLAGAVLAAAGGRMIAWSPT